MNNRFSKTPEPSYYAVISTSQLSNDDAGYEKTGAKIFELTSKQPGCLGAESTRDSDGVGITVFYWRDEKSISAWKVTAQHLVARNSGIERWYCHYELRVAKVERAYSGPDGRSVM